MSKVSDVEASGGAFFHQSPKPAIDDKVPISAEEQAALDKMFEAVEVLRAHGWRDPFHAPKDGTVVAVVTAGCTAAHRAWQDDERPAPGRWWVEEAGDLWPGRPTMFKEIAP